MKLATTLVASILSLTTLDAQATAPNNDFNSVKVQFADLNLEHEAGIAKLYRRIKAAAQLVCDQQATEQLAMERHYAACVKRAVLEAVARIDRPMLSDYVAQRDHKPAKTASTSVAAR